MNRTACPERAQRVARVDPLMVDHVRQYLSLNCRGHEAAQTKNAIAGEIALIIQARHDHRRATPRMVELAVERLVEMDEQVGSCTRGYYWCLTTKDALIAESWVLPRFTPMRRKVENARRWAARLPEQVGEPVPAGTGILFR